MHLSWAWLGLAALPMFVTLLVHYGAHQSLSYHIRRLLIPWAIWSLIYGLGKIAQALLANKPILSEFEPWMVLTGSSLHLWFLPFSVLFLAVFRPIWCGVSPMIWIFISSVISLGVIWTVNTLSLPVPLAQWLSVLPAACLGLITTGKKQLFEPLIIFSLVMAGLILLGWSNSTWQLMVSSAVIAIAFSFSLPATEFFKSLSALSLGIYLMHPLIISILNYAIPLADVQSFGIVVLVSAVGTFILSRLIPQAV